MRIYAHRSKRRAANIGKADAKFQRVAFSDFGVSELLQCEYYYHETYALILPCTVDAHAGVPTGRHSVGSWLCHCSAAPCAGAHNLRQSFPSLVADCVVNMLAPK